MKPIRFLTFALLLALTGTALHAQPRSVFIEDLTWPEVRDAIAAGKTTAIVFAGSTEQNGPHMATGKHNVVARYVAGRIAETLGDALVYPILPFAPTGDPRKKTGHMKFPGSVSLSEASYSAVAREVALSAISAGFKHVVLMGDHGDGQKALERAAARLDREWRAKGVRVRYAPDLYTKSRRDVRDYLKSHGLAPGRHAGIADTSELLYLDREGKWIRRDKLAVDGEGKGVEGDPRSATPELGKIFLDIKVANAVAQIRGFTRSEK